MTEQEATPPERGISRRRILIGAAALPMAAWLAGCATGSSEDTGGGSGPGGGSPDEEIKVAFGYVGPIADEGWTWSHDQGRLALESGVENVETSMVESIPFSEEATRTFEQMVADGAKMVIANSEYADFFRSVVDAHPDVAFMECNGHYQSDNAIQFYIEHWKVSYLMGVAAAQLSETNTMGYVASFPVNVVYADLLSLMLGARSINPDMKIKVIVFNSWFDPPKSAQAANALVDAGADFLIAGHDDPSTLEVAEKRGVWCSTWNADMRRFGPNSYVSSVELDWNDFYIREVEALKAGTWEGNRFELLKLGEGVDRDDWGDKVPQAVRDNVDEVRDKMLNEDFFPYDGEIKDNKGKVRVPAGETMSDLQLYQEMNWAPEGVEGI